MRVLMTGGTGLIGKAATTHLLAKGYEVRLLDLAEGVEISGAEHFTCDILDYDSLLKHTRGCEVIIHLAAIRNPYDAPGPQTFQVNAAGTFNVFEAAKAAGIRRVVQASSINALGAFYNTVDMDIRYFPVDEAHPVYTTDPYSFSKQTVEDIGAYYWRRDGISSLALRFPWVYDSGFITGEPYLRRTNTALRMLDELVNQPEAEQRRRIADARQRVLDFRTERPFEYRLAPRTDPWPTIYEDPLFGVYASDRFNLWAFLDERDAAQSLEKGLTAEYEGSHVLFVNAACNWLAYDTRTLLRLFFPDVTDFKSELSGVTSLVSIERARALIGFEPEHLIQNSNE